MTASASSRPRVLVVALCFPPHGAIGTLRTLRVVRRLHETGWDVNVLTCSPSDYLAGTPVDMALMTKVPSGVRVLSAPAVRPWLRLQQTLLARRSSGARLAGAADVRAGAPPRSTPPSRGRVLSRIARAKDVVDAALAIPDRETGWIAPAMVKGALAHLGRRPDVIYSSGPPFSGHLVAAGLKAALRCPWVADFRDPWARAPWRGDRYPFALRAASRLERFVIGRVDRAIFVTQANRDEFAAHYGPAVARKFEVVPNGCDPAEFDALRSIAARETETFILLHSGSLYAGRTPETLLKGTAIAIARGDLNPDRFRIRFLGVNALRTVDIPGLCRDLGLERVVEFQPRVPREQSVRAIMSASALLLLQPGHTASIPGKLYEYLAAGRPILSIAEEGEAAELVRRAGGISLTGEDPHAIADALAALVGRNDDTATQCPRSLWDGNIGAASIADVLRACVDPQGTWMNAVAEGELP